MGFVFLEESELALEGGGGVGGGVLPEVYQKIKAFFRGVMERVDGAAFAGVIEAQLGVVTEVEVGNGDVHDGVVDLAVDGPLGDDQTEVAVVAQVVSGSGGPIVTRPEQMMVIAFTILVGAKGAALVVSAFHGSPRLLRSDIISIVA